MDARPHRLNHDFEWRAPAGPYRRISPEQARSWSEHGFFVLEHAFSHEEIDAVVAEIDPWEAKVEAFLQTQKDGRLFIARSGEITFSTHLVAKSKLLREFVSGPVFRDLGHDLIGPDVRLYWDQAVYKKPGTREPFPWHQDNGYTYVEPQQYVTCWVALTDADERNGCPHVLPGLHHRGTLAHELGPLGFVCVDDGAYESVAAPVQKGGIVVFSSLTPHATGPNETDSIRKAYIVQLAPDGASVRMAEDLDAPPTPCNAPDRQFQILVGGDVPRPTGA